MALRLKHPERNVGRHIVVWEGFNKAPQAGVIVGVKRVKVTLLGDPKHAESKGSYAYIIRVKGSDADLETSNLTILFRNYRECYEDMAMRLRGLSCRQLWNKLYYTRNTVNDAERLRDDLEQGATAIFDIKRIVNAYTDTVVLAEDIRKVSVRLLEIADGVGIQKESGWAHQDSHVLIKFLTQMRKRYPQVKLPCDDNKEE